MTDWIAASPDLCEAPTVWRVPVAHGASTSARLRAALSEDERVRADRFQRSEDRDRFVVGRAALRHVLASLLRIEPDALALVDETGRKPRLRPPHDRLGFNVAHSGDWALVAVARDAPVGVDVEIRRPLPDWLRVARAHFAHAEIVALTRLPEASREAAFFACWTRKEAFVKALGAGLSARLDRFSVTIPPSPAALIAIEGDDRAAHAWRLHDLAPLPGYAGCLALPAAAGDPVFRSLPPD